MQITQSRKTKLLLDQCKNNLLQQQTEMGVFFIFSTDGATHHTVACHSHAPSTTDEPFQVMHVSDVQNSAKSYTPILFRTLEKNEIPDKSPNDHFAVLKKFPLSKFCPDDASRTSLIALLKTYYKRAADIREGFTDEVLRFIFEDWDLGWVSPKLFVRFMPNTLAEANTWGTAFASWFPEEDPACQFLVRARNEWFPSEDGEDGGEKSRAWKALLRSVKGN